MAAFGLFMKEAVMYQIQARHHFDSAHRLRGYPGKCSNLHGHRWEVEAEVAGEQLDELGMLVDFSLLKKVLREVVDPLDHRDLCEIPPFDRENPTAENLARYIYEQLKERLESLPVGVLVKLNLVRVWESPGCAAVYSP